MASQAFSKIRGAIQAAKNGLKERITKRESELASDAEKVAAELRVLDGHAQLLVTADYLAANYKGALSNFEAALAENPIRILVNNMRGYTFPGCDAVAPLAAWDTAKRYKAEILAELKAQTLDVAEAELAKFEAEHRDVLRKHGVV